MEIKIIEEKKHRLVIETKGVSHGFCNALVSEMWNDKDIKAAGYNINHPLVGIPTLIIESKADPRKALLDSIKRLKKKTADFNKEFSKAF
ncbi:MAG: DNA-directed RNA polymerase subunit L [Nanoarchaeota archaeon]|nr:DNA-directed RNA polymerase subunit L [Nanoarchaeota archaeon]